jgi:hypothetical protein
VTSCPRRLADFPARRRQRRPAGRRTRRSCPAYLTAPRQPGSGRPGWSSPAPRTWGAACCRSRSTLLRFILDSHPDLACPPETMIGSACVSMIRLFYSLEQSGFAERTDISAPPDISPEGLNRKPNAYGRYLEQRGRGGGATSNWTHINAPTLSRRSIQRRGSSAWYGTLWTASSRARATAPGELAVTVSIRSSPSTQAIPSPRSAPTGSPATRLSSNSTTRIPIAAPLSEGWARRSSPSGRLWRASPSDWSPNHRPEITRRSAWSSRTATA